MTEEVEHDIDSPTIEDDDETLSKESEIDDDQRSEKIADETVKQPTPRRKTRSQGKKAFNIPPAASPSDSGDEPTPPKRRIGRIKALPKYLRSTNELFPPMSSFHLPRVSARQRSLRPGKAGDRLKPADQVLRRRSAAAAQTTTLREPR
jgi:hypothetical protein